MRWPEKESKNWTSPNKRHKIQGIWNKVVAKGDKFVTESGTVDIYGFSKYVNKYDYEERFSLQQEKIPVLLAC